MIVYPAIDIKGGLCVRLFQGDPLKETVYSDKPLEVAKAWQSKGAEWIHLVDLDGAFKGKPVHRDMITGIVKSLSISTQVGGGIRNERDVEYYLSAGVSRVVIGTKAFEDMMWLEKLAETFPDRIALGLDARDGYIAVRGWQETTSLKVTEFLEKIRHFPLGAIIYTDISRDGTHGGVNLIETEKVLERSSCPIIASGGVSSLEDIKNLLPLARKGLNGVIVGRALYDGRVNLEEAIAVAATTTALEEASRGKL